MSLFSFILISFTFGHYVNAVYKRDNVCKVEILGTQHFSTNVKTFPDREICGIKSKVVQECCPGFQTLSPKSGCPALRFLDFLKVQTSALDGSTFVNFLLNSRIRRDIEALYPGGKSTIFIPPNSVLDPALSSDSRLRREFEREPSLVSFHICRQRVLSNDMNNNDAIETMAGEEKLRVSKRLRGETFVNCHRLILPDDEYKSSVVQFINGVPRIPAGNIFEVLEEDGRFGIILNWLTAAKLAYFVGHTDPLTFFVPTDEAFGDVPDHTLANIQSHPDTLKAVLRHHMVEDSICSEQLIDPDQLFTVDLLNLKTDCADRTVTIEGATILTPDIVARNGIIHVIDMPLMPPRARDLFTVLEESDMGTFVELIEMAELTDKLTMEGQLTVFGPTDDAFAAMPEYELTRLHEHPELLRGFLFFHIAPTRIDVKQFLEDSVGPTLLPSKELRYKTLPFAAETLCVELSCVTEGNIHANNGVLHKIDKVLIPPTQSIAAVIQGDKRLSILWSAIILAKLDTLLSIPYHHGHSDLFPGVRFSGQMTLFAVSDTAFRQNSTQATRLVNNGAEFKKFLFGSHVFENMYASCAFQDGVPMPMTSLYGQMIIGERTQKVIKIKDVPVATTDLLATNGVVHIVDRPLTNM